MQTTRNAQQFPNPVMDCKLIYKDMNNTSMPKFGDNLQRRLPQRTDQATAPIHHVSKLQEEKLGVVLVCSVLVNICCPC